MLGRIDEARSVVGNALRELAELGAGAPRNRRNTGALESVMGELLAGDTDAAVVAGEESFRLLGGRVASRAISR